MHMGLITHEIFVFLMGGACIHKLPCWGVTCSQGKWQVDTNIRLRKGSSHVIGDRLSFSSLFPLSIDIRLGTSGNSSGDRAFQPLGRPPASPETRGTCLSSLQQTGCTSCWLCFPTYHYQQNDNSGPFFSQLFHLWNRVFSWTWKGGNSRLAFYVSYKMEMIFFPRKLVEIFSF